MYYYLVGLVLLGSCLADKPQARSAEYPPAVKYGGPIVYSGEKPPIIHFPPPPEPSYANGGYGGKYKAPPAVKYVPLPHHELPVLIYQSDNSPPIHVVHTPPPARAPQSYAPPPKQSYQEKPSYNPAPPQKQQYRPPAPTKPAYKPPPPTKAQ